VDGLEVVTVFESTMCDTLNTLITLLFLVFRVVVLGHLFPSCSQIPEDDEFHCVYYESIKRKVKIRCI
jgi:hypothetical protein